MSGKIAHLEMIQAVISRMANNSFLIKGWSVTLISALFALAAKDADTRYVYVSYFPVAMFFLLDGFFLHQEKLFRQLYDEVRKSDQVDFSMSTKKLNKKDSWTDAILTKTLLIFHGTLLFTICIVMFYLQQKGANSNG